ncbi:hypothetical protein F511_36567 [Dorcoceras hygrometricum]|uniref:Uncharacterized protein n=1 Tax=Dorcoceras hygrometricum TaxID=472368 RepID=A0A2Z7B459_9LAMI|nr:hypothetical protein F511_36567 [Dorcoceras hygrometricum]
MTSAISAVVKKRKSWISDDDISSDVITISAVVKKRKSWISDDDISSDVITISSELQCNQMILEVSDSKTMSFGLIDTTAFCLRAKIQQMLFAMEITSRKLQYIQSRATALYLTSRGCIANDVV